MTKLLKLYFAALLCGMFSILGGCNHVDTIADGNGGFAFIHSANSPMGIAAATVRGQFASIAEAESSTTPQFTDSHPNGGVLHTELAGFGVTMIAHNGTPPLISPDTILNSTGVLSAPNLLFFSRGPDFAPAQWPIIGMGYSFEFDPANPPQLIWDMPHRFLIHEAGYHDVALGQFLCAVDADLTPAAIAADLSIDAAGQDNITEDSLRAQFPFIRHGRIWTLHAWFEPGTGRVAINVTDPWSRQDPGAATIPPCAFYFQTP